MGKKLIEVAPFLPLEATSRMSGPLLNFGDGSL